MLVYRIESEDGGGLYQGSNCNHNPIPCGSSVRHPLPYEDSALKDAIDIAIEQSDQFSFDFIRSNGYIFGFSSTVQLRRWIYRDIWLWKMQTNGFRLAVFEIEDSEVLVGYTQAIFKRKDIKQESYFKPAEFFGIFSRPMGHEQDQY